MRASKADKFYMGMLLAIICFCFGLLRIMDEADARRAAERETQPSRSACSRSWRR